MKKSFFKKIISILCSFFLTFSSGCFWDQFASTEDSSSVEEIEKTCEHSWKDATCTVAKKCTLCGETEGESLGHEWQEVTCEAPQKCSRCGATSGFHKGHSGGVATCSKKAVCDSCGQEYGFTLEHFYVDDKCVTCEYEKTPTDNEYFVFTLLSDGSYSVKATSKDLPEKVVVPGVYEERVVTVVEDRAFANCEQIKQIDLPSSITKIGKEAFLNCVNLIELRIPEGVDALYRYTFLNCNSLKRVSIPESLTLIEEDCFLACIDLEETHLENISSWFCIEFGNKDANPVYYSNHFYVQNEVVEEITAPESITEVKNHAFYNSSIKKISFGLKIETIKSNAFSRCWDLQTVDMSACFNLKAIEGYAFSNCTAVSTVHIPSIEVWSVVDFASTPLAVGGLKNLLLQGRLLETLEFPAVVDGVARQAFMNCKSLKKIIFNKNIQGLGYSAFENCQNLQEVVFDKNGELKIIGQDAFRNCDSLVEISFPASLQRMKLDSFDGCDNLKTVVFNPNCSVTGLFHVFDGCYSLENITLPPSIVTLETGFEDSPKLFKLDGNIYYVDNWAMKVKEGAKSIVIRRGTFGIYANIMIGNSSQAVEEVYIPKGVVRIHYSTFGKNVTIYCEDAVAPATWGQGWQGKAKVIWNYDFTKLKISNNTL